MSEIEEVRQLFHGAVGMTGIREPSVRVPEFIKEGVNHGFDSGKPLRGRVLEELGDQVNGVRVSLTEYLVRSVSSQTKNWRVFICPPY